MDFLDPRKRRPRQIKLAISYGLMALLVVVSAVILLGSSFGYGVNFKTGGLVQNGLVFVDSAPVKAKIFINGNDIGKVTPAHAIFPGSTRLILPADHYRLTLEADGYHSWSDSFHLLSQGLLRFDYPVLFPLKLLPTNLVQLAAKPLFITQSSDRRYLLVGTTTTAGQVDILQVDTNHPGATPLHLLLPSTLLSIRGNAWQVGQWSTDNNFVILKHGSGSRFETVVFDRQKPSSSINLDNKFGANITLAEFRPGNNSIVYWLTAGQVLESVNLNSDSAAVVAPNVLAFDPLAAGQVAMVAGSSKAPIGELWHDGRFLNLGKVVPSANYFAAAANYQGNIYLAIGSAKAVYLYKNPLAGPLQPKPIIKFDQGQIVSVSLSPNSRFLSVYGANHQVYNFSRSIKYVYPRLASGAVWLDDYRLGGLSGGQAVVWDYDGSNKLVLLPSSSDCGIYLSQNYRVFFNLKSVNANNYYLQTTSLTNG